MAYPWGARAYRALPWWATGSTCCLAPSKKLWNSVQPRIPHRRFTVVMADVVSHFPSARRFAQRRRLAAQKQSLQLECLSRDGHVHFTTRTLVVLHCSASKPCHDIRIFAHEPLIRIEVSWTRRQHARRPSAPPPNLEPKTPLPEGLRGPSLSIRTLLAVNYQSYYYSYWYCCYYHDYYCCYYYDESFSPPYDRLSWQRARTERKRWADQNWRPQ